MNSKMGGDLYTMKFPDRLSQERAMLIGIDVCHAGGNSIVGFAASINPEMSQYYSDFLVQKKGQEVITQQMAEPLKKAFDVFQRLHKGKLPTEIIIYRDGVSHGERDQVIQNEIRQFQQAINSMYNQASQGPKISLFIVNKRIMQSFFV